MDTTDTERRKKNGRAFMQARKEGTWESNPGRCAICQTDVIYRELDHIYARFLGGSDDPENLQWLCRDCHDEKSRREKRIHQRLHRHDENWLQQRREQNVGPKGPAYGKFGSAHPAYGNKRSEEEKQRYSFERTGSGNPFYGHKHTDENRELFKQVQEEFWTPEEKQRHSTRMQSWWASPAGQQEKARRRAGAASK